LAGALAEVMGAMVDVGASILAGIMPALNAFAQGIQLFTPLITSVVGMWGTLLGTFADVWAQGVTAVFQEAIPYVLAFGRVMMDVYKTIYRGVQALLAFVGVNLPDFGTGSAPRGDQGRSTGAAVRSTSTQDVSAVLARAREAAFAAGTGAKQDPQRQAVNHLQSIDAKATEIVDGVNKFLTDLPSRVATELGKVLDRVSESVSSGAIGVAQDIAGSSFVQGAAGAISSAGDLAKDGLNRLTSLFD
jgi:hypothetical protein